MFVSKVVSLAGSAAVVLALAGLPAAAQPDDHQGWGTSRNLTIHHHHGWRERPVAVPLDAAGDNILTPFFAVSSPLGPDAIGRLPHYQGPDGTYDDAADRWNAINGVPCGRACTDRALQRWGYLPAY